jgi:uncharacterized protein (TIGR00369 family)
VARPGDAGGLGLRFSKLGEGRVEDTTTCPEAWEGYPGLVHGGIIASLLDGAMTNALFARGVAAVTGELSVRYRGPLRLGRATRILGEVTRSRPPLHLARARIFQDGELRVEGEGKFMARDGSKSG